MNTENTSKNTGENTGENDVVNDSFSRKCGPVWLSASEAHRNGGIYGQSDGNVLYGSFT